MSSGGGSTPHPPSSLNERDASQIKLLCDVARKNGATLTVEEVMALTTAPASREELEMAWQHTPILSSSYELRSGLVVERNSGSMTDAQVVREVDRRVRAKSYLRHAARFSALCGGRYTKLMAVSGSVSYMSASELDDLDFFCVTKRDTLWVFLTRTLILARVFRRVSGKKGTPKYCFSCSMDEKFALKSFSASQGPLFARDALSAVVLVDRDDCYRSLLEEGAWMEKHYPRLYRSRLGRGEEGRARAPREARSSSCDRVLNLFLYLTVGGYIRLKSALLNRKFRHEGRRDALFSVLSGPDLCMYESEKYIDLRESYSSACEENPA